jgi:hypothetical protein
MSALRGSRTELVKHFTAQNRNVGETRVAAMVFDMRDGTIRFPSATKEDRSRMEQFKQQAINWDRRTLDQGRQARAGADDLFMAAWVGWVTIKDRLAKRNRRIIRQRQVPPVVLRRWGAPKQEDRTPQVKPETDLLAVWSGSARE